MQLDTFFDLCSGIGGGRLGLEQAGMRSVGYSDTSRLSVRTYNLMFSTEGEKNYGNLKNIKSEKLPPYDVLIAGFPCQTFSVIGRREGFDDIRGQIIFHIARILKETQPKAFILENVRGLVSHDKGKTLKTILDLLDDAGFDVTYKVLTSLDYGVPQMRQRVYFIGVNKKAKVKINDFQWPDQKPIPLLSVFLVDESPIPEWMEKYLPSYLNNAENKGQYSMSDLRAMEGKVLDTRMSDLRVYDGKVPTLRSQRDGVLYVRGGKLFSLTGHEALLLQGFPREYADKVYNVISNRHLLMQAGNAMTVNVIRALGEQLKKLYEGGKSLTQKVSKTMKEETWKKFEKDCCSYLNDTYSSHFHCQFIPEGGSNSHKPDINVVKEGITQFAIEAKSPVAQCGQFVLKADESTETFIYSKKNEFPLNKFSERIIKAMENDFEKYSEPSCKVMDIDSSLIYDWIKNHYREGRNTRFVISRNRDYVVFPIDRFEQYFSVEARYRIKGSGSAAPSKKNLSEIRAALSDHGFNYSDLTQADDGVFVNITNSEKDLFKLVGSRYRYQFKKTESGSFNVRKLSNTRNANVIFSISLKKEQDHEDLEAFLAAIA